MKSKSHLRVLFEVYKNLHVFDFEVNLQSSGFVCFLYDQYHHFHDYNILIQLKHNLKLNTLNIKSDFTILKNIECQLSNVKNNKLLTLHNYNKTNYPKTLFLYWDKPSLPLINFLTIESFNKFNNGWTIIVCISHDNKEIKEDTSDKNYFNKLINIDNVVIKEIDFKKYNCINYTKLSRINFLKFYFINRYGGIWCDFNIIFIKCLINSVIDSNKTILFNSHNQVKKSCFYTDSLLISNRNNNIFNYILNDLDTDYSNINFNILNTALCNNLNILGDINILDNQYYSNWKCENINDLLKKLNVFSSSVILVVILL